MFSKETEDNVQLIECFENDLPLEIQSRNWLKLFNSILFKCFRKIRVVNSNKKKGETDKLLHERIELKSKAKLVTISDEMKMKIEDRIREIEDGIGDEISENYHKEIKDTLKKLGGDGKNLNGSGRKHLWKLLKRKFPKCSPAIPVGKKDKSGNIITNHQGLKELYLKTYKHRLRNRPIKNEFQEMKQLKEELFELRLNLAQCNKSSPWTMDDLELILKHLNPISHRGGGYYDHGLFLPRITQLLHRK